MINHDKSVFSTGGFRNHPQFFSHPKFLVKSPWDPEPIPSRTEDCEIHKWKSPGSATRRPSSSLLIELWNVTLKPTSRGGNVDSIWSLLSSNETSRVSPGWSRTWQMDKEGTSGGQQVKRNLSAFNRYLETVLQCGAPKIAKLVYNYNFTRVYGSYNHS